MKNIIKNVFQLLFLTTAVYIGIFLGTNNSKPMPEVVKYMCLNFKGEGNLVSVYYIETTNGNRLFTTEFYSVGDTIK